MGSGSSIAAVVAQVEISEKVQFLEKAIRRENEANGGFEIWGQALNWHYEWSGWGTLMKRIPNLADTPL